MRYASLTSPVSLPLPCTAGGPLQRSHRHRYRGYLRPHDEVQGEDGRVGHAGRAADEAEESAAVEHSGVRDTDAVRGLVARLLDDVMQWSVKRMRVDEWYGSCLCQAHCGKPGGHDDEKRKSLTISWHRVLQCCSKPSKLPHPVPRLPLSHHGDRDEEKIPPFSPLHLLSPPRYISLYEDSLSIAGRA